MSKLKSTLKTALATTAAIVAATTMASALAGECPAEHRLDEPRELKAKDGTPYNGTVAATVDLEGWRDMGSFKLRLRTLTIPAKGIVPLHSHADRPAIVHIISGEIIEHNAHCAVPILHKAGATTPEFGPTQAHWWENATDTPVTAISTDVVYDATMSDNNM